MDGKVKKYKAQNRFYHYWGLRRFYEMQSPQHNNMVKLHKELSRLYYLGYKEYRENLNRFEQPINDQV